MSYKRPVPEDIFLKDIKTLIKNLLVVNPNYDNGHYFNESDIMCTLRLISDTRERANYILERIDAIDHLIKIKDEG